MHLKDWCLCYVQDFIIFPLTTSYCLNISKLIWFRLYLKHVFFDTKLKKNQQSRQVKSKKKKILINNCKYKKNIALISQCYIQMIYREYLFILKLNKNKLMRKFKKKRPSYAKQSIYWEQMVSLLHTKTVGNHTS